LSVLAVTFREGRSSAKKIWPTKPFFEVLDFKGGSQPPKSTFSVSARAGFVRLLQIRDFASDKKAVFIRDSDRWPKCATDDIMVGRYGASVGKVLTGKAGAYNVALVKIIIDPTIFDKRFVFYWLQADAFQNALKVVSRSAQNGFNKSDLESLYVPVPSLSEQKQAVRFIENAFSWVDRICSETNSARKLIEHLDQSILAKAFRGELVPQDPKDEPARVLLERIKAEREDNRSARRGRRTSAGSPA
jgi:type I restriction enzyme S subunit